MNGKDWDALLDGQRRIILDKYLETGSILASTRWEHLPYWLRRTLTYHEGAQ